MFSRTLSSQSFGSRWVEPGAIATLLAAVMIAAVPRTAVADVFPWQTDVAVGPSDVEITLDLLCMGGGLVCDLLDSYADTQTAVLSGSGDIDIDDVADTIQFQQDSSQDLGMGPIPAYSTTTASDLTFAEIPFTGIPMTEAGVVFGTTNPPISVPGLDLTAPGNYPFSGAVDYAMIADVVGDLDVQIPMLISTPSSVTLSGVLTVLPNGSVELRDVIGTLNFQDTVALLGEIPTLVVDADLTLNVSVELPPIIIPIPALSRGGLVMLAGLMIAVVGFSAAPGRRWIRR